MTIVLGLETSCDESAVALVSREAGIFNVLSSKIASQVEEHARWGGVVPEIASRKHLEALPYLISDVLNDAELKIRNIDAIAATVAPGLVGALMVGSVTARTLAALHNLPFLGIHHLEGHLSSVFLSPKAPAPPYLVLLVSGGHTELIEVYEGSKYKRLARSHDDAAGEAFDKVARLLDLPYPGGPSIQEIGKEGNQSRFSLPKGRVSKPGGGFYPYDFSFSGLKTAMLRKIESFKSEGKGIPVQDLAASFENVVAEVLVERTVKCALDHGLERIVMVGGVAANLRLRKLMETRCREKSLNVYLAPKQFCTDNAAMVAAAALERLKLGVSASSFDLGVSPRWPLSDADSFYQAKPPF